MAGIIYLVGKGKTTHPTTNNVSKKKDCYLECTIPDNMIHSGFFPSVLHSYIMYAKDIGLTVSKVYYDNTFNEGRLQSQFVYSLWPLFYVNNTELFTEGEGLPIYKITNENEETRYTKLQYHIVLDTSNGIFSRKTPDSETLGVFNYNAQSASNPEPLPNNFVIAENAWFLSLSAPVQDSGEASSYAIIKHYNQLITWNTLWEIKKCLDKPKTYDGLKGATGQVLDTVVKRDYAYDALLPDWNNDWGEKPEDYNKRCQSTNNYNIGASIFTSNRDIDLDIEMDPPVLTLLGTALNIKGESKAGHAETRLLLTLDAIDFANRGNTSWFSAVCDFYQFENASSLNITYLYNAYSGQHISLISSLKPCYLCAGEVDATENGKIKTIDSKTVDMWACFPNLPYHAKIKKVLYFDIDRPIAYPSKITTAIKIGSQINFKWDLELVPWNQWTAFLNDNAISNAYTSYCPPIGPRIVEPAGECLKTGEAFTRYKNSAYLLLTNGSEYSDELSDLTSKTVNVREVNQHES